MIANLIFRLKAGDLRWRAYALYPDIASADKHARFCDGFDISERFKAVQICVSAKELIPVDGYLPVFEWTLSRRSKPYARTTERSL